MAKSLIHSLDCRNAWLAPDGRLLPNQEYAQHSQTAVEICTALGIEIANGDHEDALIKRGWAKLRDGSWFLYQSAEQITQKQRDTIFDWCTAAKTALPAFMLPDAEPALA